MNNLINRLQKIKNIEYIVLTILIITGFSARLYKITSPIADWHSFRQADTASVSRFYVEDGVNLLYPKYHDLSRIQSGHPNPQGHRFVEFPIYNALHAVFYKYLGLFSFEVWGRLISIFASIGSAYILFLLGKRYISLWGGVITAGFFLLLPYNIYFTRVILPEPLAVFFATLSLYLFSDFIKRNMEKYLYLAAITFSLSVLIKPYTIFYLFPVAILLLERQSWKEIIKNRKLITAAVIAILPLAFWRVWIRQFPEGIPFWKWTFNGDGIRFKPAFWYWIFGERLTKLILGFWGIIPFAFGVMSFDVKRKFVHMFLFGMLLFCVVFATANVRHDYYQSITIPAISLVFALGVIKLWNTKELNQMIARGMIILSSVIMLFAGAFQVKEFYKINHPEIIAAGQAVDRLTPKDSIVIASYFGDTAFLYHTKRRGYPHVELPIEELVEEGAQYYASVDLGNPQTKEFMAKFDIIEKTDRYVILDLNRKI